MKYPNLYSLWDAARVSGSLPPEWERADVFIAWCVGNGYKAEYGLDGKFTAENLLAAIPAPYNPDARPDTGTGAVGSESEIDALCKRFTVDELLKIAEFAGVNLGRAKKEGAIAAKLVESGVTVEGAEELLASREVPDAADTVPETEGFTDEPS
jgi:hypothetical protein